ncbi:DUF3592 domain-containing protein [Aeromicrobium chenweiae]|uniref:Uncharacterized protein n=1 Tax=Aeromicrobium chenweiae TaxID=2079793 RepID=A0A2S0WI82_9ACTN|nr:DUF3592 domain-containing protein [Aeromicrobium chenweiae]AWB91049.1 hypothetical protein C3E78_01765 [Aeromicrobium chenweiae]TGN31953.1 hypothetical protein E4L97_11275 [Aeromicrobium chenweiae]
MPILVVPVAFLAGGAVLVWWALRRRRALALRPSGWLPVTGTLVGAGASRRVEYVSPDGRRLRIQVPAGVPLPDEGPVEVLLDPRDPSRARLAEPDVVAVRLVRQLLLLGIVSLVVGLVILVVLA